MHMYMYTVVCFIFIISLDGSLNELLFDPDTNEPSGLPSNQSLFYLQQILYAVHFLHQRAILHLDLKCKREREREREREGGRERGRERERERKRERGREWYQ